MELTKDERIFLRELAVGRDQFLNPANIRLDKMEAVGLVRRVGDKPLKVAITGVGRKRAEEI